ncbi:hypothetical protein B0H13DRAFT_1952305 [Mycena leptocephala]|nr:hypothetical protein B0H13DRAFT_1952305 [Mycena leptocephala]
MMLAALDATRRRTQFEEDGFVIIPGLVSPEEFPRLERACADVICRTRQGSWPHRCTNPDSWGVQHVMHPDLDQPVFSQWYTSTAVINAVQTLMGCEEDQLKMGWFGRLKPAFINSLAKMVPRTPEQRLHSKGQDARADPLDMPGAIRVSLQPGESVFYNSNILHCVTYDAHAPRSTLHASMGNVAGGSVRARNVLQHGLSWMKEPQFSNGLDARGKAMLGRLLALYNSVGDVSYSLSG